MRQLLFFSLLPASAGAFSVVVDQLELAAAADGWLRGGVAAAVCVAGAGAACGAGAGSLTEPNQRAKRFPLEVALLVVLGGSALATEVLHAPGASVVSPGLLVVVVHCGEALAVRVGGGSG